MLSYYTRKTTRNAIKLTTLACNGVRKEDVQKVLGDRIWDVRKFGSASRSLKQSLDKISPPTPGAGRSLHGAFSGSASKGSEVPQATTRA